MKTLNRSATFLVLLCFTLLVMTGGGCSSKKPPAVPDKTQANLPRIEPTQRPYTIKGITYYPIPSAAGYVERGKASWYGKKFHGKKTASGEPYDMHGFSAAHKTLPMNTVLLVKNLDNGRSSLARVNDRGPFSKGRILDLSYATAKELGIIGAGLARVEIVAMENHAKGQSGPPVLATAPKRDATTGQFVAPPSATTASSKGPTIALATASNAAPTTSRKIAQIKMPGQKIQRSPVASAGKADNTDHGKFFVQVGAYDDLHDARTMAKNFASKGKDVTIQQYPAAGMNFYRVLVFAGNSLVKARSFERQLKDDGFNYALLLAK